MPCDPRIWTETPLDSTYPACQAVKAAAEQGPQAAYRYLRTLREGIMFGRRKLDHADALIAAAGPVRARPSPLRDRPPLARHHRGLRRRPRGGQKPPGRGPGGGASIAAPRDASGSASPRRSSSGRTALATGSGGAIPPTWRTMREGAFAAGAKPVNEGPLEPLAAVGRFGRFATLEPEVLCDRPRPVVEAELWALARDSKLKPVYALTGTSGSGPRF